MKKAFFFIILAAFFLTEPLRARPKTINREDSVDCPTHFLFSWLCREIAPPGAVQGEEAEKVEKKGSHDQTLTRIYGELKDFKAYPGESFIRADFFVGSEDDDDTYKDIHVSVVLQREEAGARMNILATTLEASRGQPQVKLARESRALVCLIEPAGQTRVRLFCSDFKKEDLGPFLASLLGAIQKKKKLLSLCGSERQG